MATDLTNAIVSNASGTQSMTNDGVTVVSQSVDAQIAAQKFLGANEALSAIASGASWFARVRMVPPGARGGNTDGDL